MGEQTEREILKILENAIQREKAAQKLYERGEQISEDEEMRAVFAMLAEEEHKHEKLIREMYYEHKKKLGLEVLGGNVNKE